MRKLGRFATALLLLGCSSTGNHSGGTGGTGGGAGMAGGGGATEPFSCTSSGESAQMVSVPAGDFLMGCNAAVDGSCADDEQPGRTVTLSSSFQIDVMEVTQDQYAACVTAGACTPPLCDWNCDLKNRPAMCVNWDQAKAFCAYAGKRLPSEAEWEKAARGTDGRKYPWGNEEVNCTYANMQGCGDSLEDVGGHPDGASPYGALDMAGNMVEMVADWYDAKYYSAAPNVDPKGPPDGDTIGGRGGGWKSDATWQRASARDWYNLDDKGTSLGFRCAQ